MIWIFLEWCERHSSDKETNGNVAWFCPHLRQFTNLHKTSVIASPSPSTGAGPFRSWNRIYKHPGPSVHGKTKCSCCLKESHPQEGQFSSVHMLDKWSFKKRHLVFLFMRITPCLAPAINWIVPGQTSGHCLNIASSWKPSLAPNLSCIPAFHTYLNHPFGSPRWAVYSVRVATPLPVSTRSAQCLPHDRCSKNIQQVNELMSEWTNHPWRLGTLLTVQAGDS